MRLRDTTDVGRLIRSRRRELNLTQAALADLIGATRAWVIAVEAGKDHLDLHLVLRALDALELELHAATTRPLSRLSTLETPRIPEQLISSSDITAATTRPERQFDLDALLDSLTASDEALWADSHSTTEHDKEDEGRQ